MSDRLSGIDSLVLADLCLGLALETTGEVETSCTSRVLCSLNLLGYDGSPTKQGREFYLSVWKSS